MYGYNHKVSERHVELCLLLVHIHVITAREGEGVEGVERVEEWRGREGGRGMKEN